MTTPHSDTRTTASQTKLYADFQPQSMSAKRLAQIWRSLPEAERFGFLLALREDLADRLLELTMPAVENKPV
jgi:hypothetical protein